MTCTNCGNNCAFLKKSDESRISKKLDRIVRLTKELAENPEFQRKAALMKIVQDPSRLDKMTFAELSELSWGDPIFEDLRRAGMNIEGYKFTNESKKQLIEGLSIAIEQGKISYPDIPELINELRIFGYKYSAGGTISYNAPPGYHDDCVISLALASYGIDHRNRGGFAFLGGLPKVRLW